MVQKQITYRGKKYKLVSTYKRKEVALREAEKLRKKAKVVVVKKLPYSPLQPAQISVLSFYSAWGVYQN